MDNSCYEKYPYKTVLITNLLSLSIYIIGAYIIYGLGLIFALIYLLYCLIMEIHLLKNGCVNCYYYGKICAFGKGRLSALFFKKGDVSQFISKKLSWKDMIPDMLIFILPLIAGIIILIFSFSWIIMILMIALILLSSIGNGLVRGYLTCKKCNQRILGCPAEKLFQKDEKSN